MSDFDPYYSSLDSLVLADYACMVEEVRGTRSVAARRSRKQSMTYRHGSRWPAGGPYFDEKVLRLAISVFGTDKDGDCTHPAGHLGHLQSNLDDLFAVFGKRDLIDYRQLFPAIVDDEAGTVEAQGHCWVRRAVEVSPRGGAWDLDVELVFPYPFLHELPQVTRSAATSHSFNTGGTAPIADMVFTFSGAGTLTYESQTITVSEGCVVDVGKREVYVGGSLDMDALDPQSSMRENWMEWPARTDIALTSTTPVAVAYYRARH